MICRLRHIALACLALLFCVGTAAAQDDGKDWLTRQIQDALSDAGRTVSIDGFQGALSSEASFDRLTIADKDGIWLTLEGAVLSWNRSALLRGRLEVEQLTATRLDLPRLPVSDKPAVQAEAEPFTFSLPDLPVSIEISAFGIDTINLGAPILGEEAQINLAAKARYTETEAFADFTSQRTDGKEGRFEIKADLQRAESVLTLLLKLTEAEEGIAARLLGLPGQPAVEMSIDGTGPLDDFRADVRLATDNEPRLAGQITLAAQAPRRPSDQPDRRFTADISGDITALLAPRYRDFFGADVQLQVDALREASGAIEVSDFHLRANVADLKGKVSLNQDNWPTFIAVTGTVASPDGTPVLLPGGGEGATVQAIDLRVDYDASQNDAFDAAFDVTDLASPEFDIGKTRLALDGTLQGNLGSVGQFLSGVQFDVTDLTLRDPALAEAVGTSLQGTAEINYIEGQPVRIEKLDLTGTDYGLSGKMAINGVEQGFLTRLNVRLDASDLSRFSALVGQEVDGQSDLALKGTVTPLGGAFELMATGSTQDLRFGIAQADAVLAGRTQLSVQAVRNETGTVLRDLVLENDALSLTGAATLRTDASEVEAQFRLADTGLVVPQYDGPITVEAIASQDTRGWLVDARTMGPYRASITAKGLATGPTAALSFTADVPDVTPFAAPAGQDISGPLTASGALRRAGEGWALDTTATGPYDVTAAVEGRVAPQIDVEFDASVPDINPLVPQLRGTASANGRLRQTDEGFFVDTSLSGPYGAGAQVEGLATGPDMSLTFDATLPDLTPFAPGVPGTLKATGVLRQTSDGIYLDTNATGPYATRGNVKGVVTGPNAAVDFDLAMANIGALVERVSGPLTVSGSAQMAGAGWRVDTNAEGPAGTTARIEGLVGNDGNLNLDVNGSAPLGLTRPFIVPRNLQGIARFDLAVNGPATLSSLSGTVETSGATLTAPNLRVALEGIDARIGLGGNRATVEASARASNGGQVRIDGSVILTPSLPAELSLGVQNVILIDPRLFRTSLSGDLRVAGPLTGGASVAGQITVGETNISVPATGLTSIGDIPPITHVGARPGAIATRRKAGFDGAGTGIDPAAAASGPGYGLNLTVNAPNRIFVRGRGLDAELGGGLRLTGTTNNMISSGRFDLIRGRLDILGKRFDLREGSIQFQGDLVPYIRFVSATDTAQGEARVIVEGPADAPEVTFEATPDAPEDEVLAQLLFGRNISQISAFQALQLASAVATLAGRGGGGIIGNLREGFGLDDLDVTTTDDGATALRLGKYISDNVYTDVTASSDGEAEISLNLDISPNLTARGTLGSDGESSIGIFFEKDY